MSISTTTTAAATLSPLLPGVSSQCSMCGHSQLEYYLVLPPPKPPEPVFTSEFLKSPNINTIHALHDALPLQCKTCGRRFVSSEMLGKHLDWHFLFASRCFKTSSQRSQPWMISENEWIYFVADAPAPPSFFEKQKINAVQPTKTTYPPVPADDTQTSCAICTETFENYHEPDSSGEEVWFYKDAVYTHMTDGEKDRHKKARVSSSSASTASSTTDVTSFDRIVHISCYESLLETPLELKHKQTKT